MNRRKFVFHLRDAGAGLLLASVAGGAAMTMAGCDELKDLEAIVPEAIDAVTQIVTVFDPPLGSVLQIADKTLQGLWTAAQAAIAEYKSTDPPPVGTKAKVLTALQDVSDQLATIIGALPVSVPAGTLALVKLGLQITIATINWFTEKHGATTTAKAKTAAASVKCATSKKEYVAKINALKIPTRAGFVTLK